MCCSRILRRFQGLCVSVTPEAALPPGWGAAAMNASLLDGAADVARGVVLQLNLSRPSGMAGSAERRSGRSFASHARGFRALRMECARMISCSFGCLPNSVPAMSRVLRREERQRVRKGCERWRLRARRARPDAFASGGESQSVARKASESQRRFAESSSVRSATARSR
jgi:hypothetical protein